MFVRRDFRKRLRKCVCNVYTRYTPTTQGYIQVHESTHQLDKGIHKYNQLYDDLCIHQPGKAYTKTDTMWYKSIHRNSRAYTNKKVHQHHNGIQLYKLTIGHTNIQGRVQTTIHVWHNYTKARTYKTTIRSRYIYEGRWKGP